jgi:hypothetical protein
MDIASTLNQAITAARAGRKAEARRLLETVLDADERNEQAWLWLSGVVESEEERIICLENVLVINPDNQVARKGLAALRATATSPSSPLPPSEHSATTVGYPPGEALRAGPPSDDSPAGRLPATDNRAFIVITIILILILVCTVTSIIAFVMLAPPT